MVLGNIKSTNKERGFTIVELLIVIVVIGILAAITIVAYSGITARANATKAQTNAAQIQKIAEAYNADNSVYPAAIGDFSGVLAKTAKLPSGLTLVKGGGVAGTSYASGALALAATVTAALVTSANGTTTVAFLLSGAIANPTGGVVYYWDYTATTPAIAGVVYYGAATSTSTFFAPAP
jgi:prepilin-type N-terminal cleavage/methylation domain-containing protein